MYVQVNALTSFGLRLGANYTWSANFSDSEEFSNDGAAVRLEPATAVSRDPARQFPRIS